MEIIGVVLAPKNRLFSVPLESKCVHFDILPLYCTMEGVVTGRRCNEHDEMRRVVGRSVHIVFYPLNTSNGIGIEPIRRTPKGSLPGNFWETPRFLHAFCFSRREWFLLSLLFPDFLLCAKENGS